MSEILQAPDCINPYEIKVFSLTAEGKIPDLGNLQARVNGIVSTQSPEGGSYPPSRVTKSLASEYQGLGFQVIYPDVPSTCRRNIQAIASHLNPRLQPSELGKITREKVHLALLKTIGMDPETLDNYLDKPEYQRALKIAALG